MVEVRERLSIGELLVAQASIGGFIAIVIFVSTLSPDWVGRTITAKAFCAAIVFNSVFCYLALRCFFGRTLSMLCSMVCAAHVGMYFREANIEAELTIAVLSAWAAGCLIFGFRWLDREDLTFLKRNKRRVIAIDLGVSISDVRYHEKNKRWEYRARNEWFEVS